MHCFDVGYGIYLKFASIYTERCWFWMEIHHHHHHHINTIINTIINTYPFSWGCYRPGSHPDPKPVLRIGNWNRPTDRKPRIGNHLDGTDRKPNPKWIGNQNGTPDRKPKRDPGSETKRPPWGETEHPYHTSGPQGGNRAPLSHFRGGA